MKRMVPVLAAAAVAAGATLAGAAPASAASPAVDCAKGEYTRVLRSYIPTNVQRPAVDGHSYNIGGGLTYDYEVCLDIPDTSTFTIEVRVWASDGSTRVIVDDRPGDKIVRYSLAPNSFWQVYGTMTGPGSTYIYYTWNEKQTTS
ncbi:hypothetical protein ACPCHT_29415 [Nucisporomicrobium flavum]|jgi:hypothetical protein|uniref:hypothetical protein n=1 Tax=Nucisporomicrobium flavum TaxID=2785915 RepID=UPI0018F5D449|nr:hypothetical protein [Nucisporomicrobium flavum]